jgi:outer membrane protein assembly factor BamB
MTQNFDSGRSSEKQLQPGVTLLNRYQIQDVIGIGGMGAVYRARDMHFPNTTKFVAVKEMINTARDALVRQTIVQNFEREANILATLSHPSIPKIFDFFTHDERSYLVEEYVQGKDLEAILNQTQGFLPEDMVIGWAVELCDVLSYLHTHKPEPIIFRDMKPSNVMINQQGHIMLVDFGIAKVFKTGQKGTMIGTEGYSPPEQYRGEATISADIYALGATIHHLLTRRDPRLEAPFTFHERPVRQINVVVSAELEAVVNSALQYNPQDRFPSAQSMKEALLGVAKKTGALNRISLSRAGPSAVKEQNVKPIWVFKCEDEIRSTPIYDSGVVYVGSYDNNLYAIDASNGQFIWKFPTEGGVVCKPAIAEGLVFFGSEDNRLYAVSARTGKISWTYLTEGAVRSSPRIAEGHIFVGSDDGYLHAVSMATSRRAWKAETGAPVRSSPSFQNDFIYFGCENGEVLCADLRGQIKWRYKCKRAVTASPLNTENTVFVPSLDASFYAIDAKSGYPVWRFMMGKGSVSSPCRIDNYIYLGSADNFIYCVDAATSKEVWRFKAEHQVSGSPAVNQDTVFCGAADGYLYALDYRTGRLRWKFKTGAAITGAPAINNDIIYIGSLDHNLYAFPAQ